MNPYILAIILISTVAGVAKGFETYGRTKREREAALVATHEALTAFGKIYRRAESAVRESYQLRQQVIQKTDTFLRFVSEANRDLGADLQTAGELIATNQTNAAQVTQLAKQARDELKAAAKMVGQCRTVLSSNKLPSVQQKNIEKESQKMATAIQEARARLSKLEELGARCDTLGQRLAEFVRQSAAVRDRLTEIEREADRRKTVQTDRQREAAKAMEQLRQVQNELRQISNESKDSRET